MFHFEFFSLNAITTLLREIMDTFCVEMPKIKLEYSRGSFYYRGENLYNELPLELRQTESYDSFDRRLLNNF